LHRIKDIQCWLDPLRVSFRTRKQSSCVVGEDAVSATASSSERGLESKGDQRTIDGDSAPETASRPAAGARLRYLDVGCSEGHITASVAAYLGLDRESAVGIDVRAVAQTDEDRKFFEFRQYDGSRLEFGDAEFDLVTIFAAAHHFERQTIAATLASIHRVCKPGATLIVREHDVRDDDTRLFLDLVHAIYMSVCGTEMTPQQFAESYQRGCFASYASAEHWAWLFLAAGFNFVTSSATGDMFDTGYLVFRKQ
jgi:ubiquinone/menaquinone biosynthesis C-methylase UbiE